VLNACIVSLSVGAIEQKMSFSTLARFGIGFFVGYGLSYAYLCHQKNLINHHWDESERRAKEIINMLENIMVKAENTI